MSDFTAALATSYVMWACDGLRFFRCNRVRLLMPAYKYCSKFFETRFSK